MLFWTFVTLFYLYLPENIQAKIHSAILFFASFPYLFLNITSHDLLFRICCNYEYNLMIHSLIYYICNTIRISTIEYHPKMKIFIFHHFFTIVSLIISISINCKLLDFLCLSWASVGGFFYHLSLLKPKSILCRTLFIFFYAFSRLMMLYFLYIFLLYDIFILKLCSSIIFIENFYFLWVLSRNYIKFIKNHYETKKLIN